jgi:hypothetical protein
MFPISEVRRVNDKTVCKGQRITRASLYGKAVFGLADSPGRCKDCRTYNPPDGGGGLRWSTERFSNPDGSSYRDGGGRTFLGGKCDCDTSGSLVYGEGDARCPAGGVDPRLKKLMARSCKRKIRSSEQIYLENLLCKGRQWREESSVRSVVPAGQHRHCGPFADRVSDYIIFAYAMDRPEMASERESRREP